MKNLEELKQDYAELLIREGLNLQKGQRMAITCPVECADFARICVRTAYKAGCREVLMRWRDDEITREKYLHAEEDVFDSVNPWEADFCNMLSEEGAAWLSIYAEDPDCLKGVDAGRIRRAEISSGKALEPFRTREMRSEFPWCVCSVPTAAWAKAVFPDLDEEAAVARLWEEILAACRVDGGDAVANWRKHSVELRKHVDILNSYNFARLKYKNSAGTDVTVELPEGHYWGGGAEESTNEDKLTFSANIPTEEVFTLPRRDGINGRLVATKPLSHNGTLIEGFWFDIKDGKIVDLHADKGEEILRDAIAVDEGASYFGEVALVPYDSPISNSGVLFLNTLFDENAACHFAFGEAYPLIKGAENMSKEELKERGVNFSMTHVDFMVGSPDLEITGITHDGEEVAIFRNGNFAF
ncbi:MAG: aminopeptidase [Clostridiales bacterium]|nr:aminopeptidase [Clostridiales bacterium]